MYRKTILAGLAAGMLAGSAIAIEVDQLRLADASQPARTSATKKSEAQIKSPQPPKIQPDGERKRR
jgi:hypothetical protein